MFDKQRRKAVAEYAYKSAEQDSKFDASIRTAEEIKDPAAKVLAFRKVIDDIATQIEREGGVIDRTALRESNKTALGGMSSTAIAATATTFLVAGPIAWVGFPVFIGGLAATGLASKFRKNSVQKDLEAASKEHIERMAKRINLVSGKIDNVMNDNVMEISKSPLYPKIQAVPDLATQFAAVAARKLAEPKPEVKADEVVAVKDAPQSAREPEPKTGPRKKIDPRDWSKSLHK